MSVLLVVVVSLAGASIVIHSLRVGISPMPTLARVRDVVLEMTPRELEGEVHELGAGWGTLAFALARHCPGARVIAWETSLVPFAVMWLRVRMGWAPVNVELRRRDFFTADLRRARAVVCYLFTGAMESLAPKLDAELPQNSIVISHTFAFRGWKPERMTRATDLYFTPVYRYVMPATRLEFDAFPTVRLS